VIARRRRQAAPREPVAELLHTREFNPVASGYYIFTLERR